MQDNEQQQVARRRRRKKDAMRFGDEDFTLSEIDEYDEAGWGEVFTACCSHTPQETGQILLGVIGIFFFLYWFLFSLDLMQVGAKVLGGCPGGRMFAAEINPISAVMLGAITTALFHSSSTTTSIVVALVSEGSISVNEGVYFVMGANIGTTITNDTVALAQFKNVDEFERAFSAACLHDMFNILTVAVLLPFELLTGYLKVVTKLIVDGAETQKGEEWKGPIKLYVEPLTSKFIISNRKAILQTAESEMSCHDFYPTTCVDGLPESAATCHQGFVACDKSSDECPIWFREGASLTHDKVAGAVTFFVSLIMIYFCVTAMMAIAQWLLKGLTTRVVYKVANVNGYFGIALGAGLTMMLQSSSLTTSILTPWAGIGVLRIEQMYPLTLGANIGTTVTAILAALVASGLDPLQVALCHLFFNITGVLIWYPIPHLRRLPIFLAKKIGKSVAVCRPFAVVYILFVYFLFPLLVVGLSEMFTNNSKVGASVIIGLLCAIVLGVTYWCWCKGGQAKTADFITNHSFFAASGPAPEDPAVPLSNNTDDEDEQDGSDNSV